MRIGIVGGAECVENEYRRLVKNRGHEIDFHSGHMTSGGARSLETLIHRCDLVVIVTDVNSHAAVAKARRLARSAGRSPVFARRFGVRALSAILEGAESAPAAARRPLTPGRLLRLTQLTRSQLTRPQRKAVPGC